MGENFKLKPFENRRVQRPGANWSEEFIQMNVGI